VSNQNEVRRNYSSSSSWGVGYDYEAYNQESQSRAAYDEHQQYDNKNNYNSKWNQQESVNRYGEEGYPSSYKIYPAPGFEKKCNGSTCCYPKCFAEKGSRVSDPLNYLILDKLNCYCRFDLQKLSY
jgi:hypothetical protein